MRHWYLSLCMGGVWSDGWISIQPSEIINSLNQPVRKYRVIQEEKNHFLGGGDSISHCEENRISIQPADQSPPLQSDKYQCRNIQQFSPDDGYMDARNM